MAGVYAPAYFLFSIEKIKNVDLKFFTIYWYV